MRCWLLVGLLVAALPASGHACTPEQIALLTQHGCSQERIEKKCKVDAFLSGLTSLKSQKPPKQGVYKIINKKKRLAPFQVTTPEGDDMYYLKLSNPNSKRDAELIIFMRAGSTYRTDVPLGTFVLRYATGPVWYGDKNLFGPCETRFHEADAKLEFSKSGNSLRGHKIELIKQVGGNLDSVELDEEAF